MKSGKIILAVATVFCALACTEKELLPSASVQELTITASFDETKTALQEDGKVFWEVGDKINVFCNGEGGEFTSTVTAPAATSKFTGSLNYVWGFDEEEGTVPQNPLWGVYPYNSVNTSDGSSVTAVLPAIQEAKAGTFAKDSYLAVGTSNSTSMAFYGVCGGIRFTVTRNDIVSVVFKGNNSEKLAGKLKVQFGEDGTPEVASVSSAATVITLSAPEGETLQAGQWYYIVANPVELSAGYEMIFYTSNKCATRTSSEAATIRRKTFGSIANADADLDFVEKHWSLPTVVNVTAGTLAMEINPVTGKPVLAVVQNVASSRGPLLVYNDIKSAPVTVTPAENANNQYAALGIASNGMMYAYTQNATSKKGEIYTSADGLAWTSGITTIDQTNMYYGTTIGTLGNEVFMMTSNNPSVSGGIQKRNINVTSLNGSGWSTGNVLAGRTVKNTYYPVMQTVGNKMYTFVTNVGEGIQVYSYDGSAWTSIINLNVATSEEYKKYSYGPYEPQGMAIDADGYFWFALGVTVTDGYAAAVIRVDPEDGSVIQIGDMLSMGKNSISARSAKIGITSTGAVYLVYRDADQCLNVSTLDDDSYEWKTPEKLTNVSAGDINIRCNAAGKAYIVCTTEDHVEVFESL